MKNFLIAFLVFLIWSFFAIWLYSWLQPIDTSSLKKDTIAVTETKEIGLDIDNPLQIDESLNLNKANKDTLNLTENIDIPKTKVSLSKGLRATTPSGDLIFLFSEGISIYKNTPQIEYSTTISDFKYKINGYLIEHPNEELHILSLYSASENIENPNFGFQRGTKVKEILSQMGIANEKIVVKPMIREIEFNENKTFNNGISFSFLPFDIERVTNLRLSVPQIKTIYPKWVNNDIFVNEDLQNLLAEVKQALEVNPSLIVHIVGHTDNIGNAIDNYRLGLKFARQVRWYLVNKGEIDRKKIIATSEGEAKSIAGNTTERGRFLNRRIEIIYKTN